MTPEEHRRLDATVAEKVMGWHPRNVGIREQLRFTPPDGESPTGAYPVDVGPGEEWSPSTDIAAAWEVVEKLTNDGIKVSGEESWKWDLIIKVCHSEDLGWFVDIFDGSPMGYVGKNGETISWKGVEVQNVATAPLAICLAALKAVDLGVTVE